MDSAFRDIVCVSLPKPSVVLVCLFLNAGRCEMLDMVMFQRAGAHQSCSAFHIRSHQTSSGAHGSDLCADALQTILLFPVCDLGHCG